MNAQDFVNAIKSPVVFFNSVGNPRNRIAVLHETELPFSLSSLEGDVVDGTWRWNGEGEPADCRGNTVVLVTIDDDAEEWDTQSADYEAQS